MLKTNAVINVIYTFYKMQPKKKNLIHWISGVFSTICLIFIVNN